MTQATQVTLINTQGIGDRQFKYNTPAMEAIEAGDVIVDDSPTETRLATPADANVKILRLAEEKRFGQFELEQYTQATTLAGYEIGDIVESYVPSHDDIWGVNVYNATGAPVDLSPGQKFTLSGDVNGKLAVAVAFTTVGITPYQLSKAITIPATSSALADCFYIGQ